jgi:hypothetical protein
MSEESGMSAGGPGVDQAVVRVGEKVLDLMSAAGLLPDPSDKPAATPFDIGRMLRAFVQIHDPRIRSEFVSLIEALKGFASR